MRKLKTKKKINYRYVFSYSEQNAAHTYIFDSAFVCISFILALKWNK